MSELINQIATNPIFITIGWAVTIISLILSCYFYKRSLREKLPRVKISSRTLISNYKSIINNLNINYCDKEVDNLTITNIALWNAGKGTINKSDLVSKDMLRVELLKKENVIPQILHAEVLFENNPANNFLVEQIPESNEIHIGFDYIDFNDGVVLQIIHTGLGNNIVEINGSIKGYGKISVEENVTPMDNPILMNLFYKYYKLDSFIAKMVRKIYPYFVLLLALEIFYISFFDSRVIYQYMNLLNNNIGIMWKLMSVLVLLLSLVFIYSERKIKIPKNLEILNTYFEQF